MRAHRSKPSLRVRPRLTRLEERTPAGGLGGTPLAPLGGLFLGGLFFSEGWLGAEPPPEPTAAGDRRPADPVRPEAAPEWPDRWVGAGAVTASRPTATRPGADPGLGAGDFVPFAVGLSDDHPIDITGGGRAVPPTGPAPVSTASATAPAAEAPARPAAPAAAAPAAGPTAPALPVPAATPAAEREHMADFYRVNHDSYLSVSAEIG